MFIIVLVKSNPEMYQLTFILISQYSMPLPNPFTVHRTRPRTLADFALKDFLCNFGNFVNFLDHLLAQGRSHSP